MAVYNPPTEDLPIFDNNVFTSGNEVLTVDIANNNYLKFPIAQGAETLTDITVLGTSTFNGTVNVDNQLIVTGPIVVADVFPAPTQVALLTSSQLTFTDASTTNLISLDDTQILLSSTATPNSIDIKNNVMTLTNVSGSNTLTADDWTGNIRTVNTNANLTHYLNFSDQSATGYGHPQKTASISCNPALGSITATTFNGSISTAATAVGVNLTSDNTAGAYFVPFSKTTTATGNALYIDNTTTPLSYNPSTSRLSCNEFSGDLLGNATSSTFVNTTNDNTNTAYNLVFCAGISASATLLIDSVTSPLTYNPATGNISCLSVTSDIQCSSTTAACTFAGTTLTFSGANFTLRNGTVTFVGTANTVATLNLSSNRNNAIYNIGIRNNGSLGASFLTGLGANILTTYSSTVVVPAGTSALMRIVVLTIAGVSTSVVSIDLLT